MRKKSKLLSLNIQAPFSFFTLFKNRFFQPNTAEGVLSVAVRIAVCIVSCQCACSYVKYDLGLRDSMLHAQINFWSWHWWEIISTQRYPGISQMAVGQIHKLTDNL